MPNIKSAKKELRKSIKRNAYNKKIKDDLKDLIKKSRKAITAGDAKEKELTAKTMKAIDKAVQKKIIKPNTGNRNKSKLHLKLNKISKK